ncbi:hypothetical protein [Bacillus sp. FJAT-49736]|uniref:hypothetical protein n=1 Tax=Bacillus sp. FJAT-49736 TaxID=2833582 RepID=UPI001BC9DF19|nr:hypothetical protein [Bacillus sp. FJAT-49736]MBS4175109.1 hypothetical protein [Bacillus sp. FJAT-49736]
MRKRGIITLGIGSAIIISCFITYWFHFAKPSSFLSDTEIYKRINHSFPNAAIDMVQGSVELDSRHVFVPFKTRENKYGFSCWTWSKHKWELTAINTIGDPYLWKMDKDDPATYRFIWNINTYDKVKSIHFYFARDKNYHVNMGVEYYDPKIQMQKEVLVKDQSYGFMKLPKDWIQVMESQYKVESEKQPDLPFFSFMPLTSIYFGWIPYDEMGKEVNLNNFVDRTGFGSFGNELEDVRLLSKKDVDF